MATFSAMRSAFTPATNADNMVLDADTAGDVGRVKMITWGGNQTTAGAGNAFVTRWVRPSTNASSTFTALTLQNGNPGATALNRCGTFASAATLPTAPASLYNVAWSSFGGGGTIMFTDGDGWLVVNSATAGHSQISCRNDAGTEASTTSYGIMWAE